MTRKPAARRRAKPGPPPVRQYSRDFSVNRAGERRYFMIDWIPTDLDDAIRAKLERNRTALRPLVLGFLKEWADR